MGKNPIFLRKNSNLNFALTCHLGGTTNALCQYALPNVLCAFFLLVNRQPNGANSAKRANLNSVARKGAKAKKAHFLSDNKNTLAQKKLTKTLYFRTAKTRGVKGGSGGKKTLE